MFHPALWKLIRLQWHGGFRQFTRSLRTFRGLFHFGFIIAMLVYGTGSMYFAGRLTSRSPQLAGTLDTLQTDIVTLGLFGVTCYTILFSTGEAVVYFTSSEVAFLFPAPLTRKQLLTYKLMKSFLGIAAISAFLSLFSIRQISLAIPRFAATMLTITFLQLLTMNVAFARQVLQENMHVLFRRLLGSLLAVLVVLAIAQTMFAAPAGDFTTIVKGFQQSTAGTWLLAPFQVFVWMLRAPDFRAFVPPAAVVLGIDLLLFVLAFRLDALSLEAALATSEKMAARMKRVQSKGVWQAFGTTSSAVAQRRIRQLPFWGGVGPVVWQRMTTTFRSSTKLLWVLAGAVLFAGVMVYSGSRSSTLPPFASPIFGVVAMGYMSLLICLTMQNDIERVGYLKSLPISTVSIVLGELLGFVMLMSAVQTLFILVLASIFQAIAPWLLTGAALTIPFNFLLFGIDKLIFYIYPTRLAKGAPGDFQNSGKQMIFMALKLLMLGLAASIVALATLPGALLLSSPLVSFISAAIVLGIECAILVPLLTRAFDRFDPSTTLVS